MTSVTCGTYVARRESTDLPRDGRPRAKHKIQRIRSGVIAAACEEIAMKKLLLILGIASVSMLAVAQSNDAAATRDQSTGQASGKRMHKPLPNAQQAYEQSVITARETG